MRLVASIVSKSSHTRHCLIKYATDFLLSKTALASSGLYNS